MIRPTNQFFTPNGTRVKNIHRYKEGFFRRSDPKTVALEFHEFLRNQDAYYLQYLQRR